MGRNMTGNDGTRWGWRLVVRVVLAVYWSALFVLTHLPVPPSLPDVEDADKIAHFGAYAILACLLALSRPLTHRAAGAAVWMVGILALYAAVDELLQTPVGRECEFWDWVADVAGVVAGLALFRAAQRVRSRAAE